MNTSEENQKTKENVEKNLDPLTMPDIVNHPYYEKAFDLFILENGNKQISSHEALTKIRQILLDLTGIKVKVFDIKEQKDWPICSNPEAWKDSIHPDHIVCMICGKNFQMLSKKHIQKHGGTKEDYYNHFKIPKSINLVCKQLSKEKSESIKKSKVWENKKRSVEESVATPEDESILNAETINALINNDLDIEFQLEPDDK